MAFLFPENMISFFTDGKWKMIFLKNYMEIWCFYMLVKVVFLFPTNMKLPICRKSKDDLFPKNTRKENVSGITEKDGIHSRKEDIGILDWHSRKSFNDFFFFPISIFFQAHSRFTGHQGKWEAIYLTPLYHFHPLHRHLDISRTITAERSALYIARSQNRTGNLWFPSANH